MMSTGASCFLVWAVTTFYTSVDALTRPNKASELDIPDDNEAEQEDPNHCLRFLHIPKTAGTTLEALNLRVPRDDRPFHSILETRFDAAAFNEHVSASEMFESSHSNGSSYVYWMMNHPNVFDWVKMPDDNWCTTVHTPPALDGHSAEFFKDGHCSSFCVVRNPLDRFVSTWKFDKLRFDDEGALSKEYWDCSVTGFEEFVALMVRHLKDRPYESFCHWVSQTSYIYGGPSRDEGTGIYCHQVLRMENLAEDFNELMQRYKSDVRLSDSSPRFFNTDDCHLDMSLVSQKTKDLIYDLYKSDFDDFGYAKPE